MKTDEGIAATLQILPDSSEFAQGEGQKFKDPMRYVVSFVCLADPGVRVLDLEPLPNGLNRMGEPPYGYPLDNASWSSPGQMVIRFEIAKAMGQFVYAPWQLWMSHRRRVSLLAGHRDFTSRRSAKPCARLGCAPWHRQKHPGTWNTLLLASPEWMIR